MKKTIRLISIFSVNKSSGHSIYDDTFYFDLSKKSNLPFTFYASPYSISQLTKKCAADNEDVSPIFVENKGLITTLRAIMSIPVLRNDRVVFLGYSEKFVSLFLLFNLFRKYELVIVATNNICAWRISKYKNRLKVFFLLINRRLKRFVVHTEEERRLCQTLSDQLFDKVVLKKHHLMIPREEKYGGSRVDGKIVAFFGPEKPGKPVQPMIDLVKNDTELSFDYRFFNVDQESVVCKYGLSTFNNVEILNKWLSKEEYFGEFSNSSLIMMTHDKSFEGKLSGNLCDCISLGVPFISSDIEPVRSLARRYGPIGYVYDMDKETWVHSFLEDFSPESYRLCKDNLRKLGEDYERSVVEEDNAKVLLQ